jgi:hypothetical protein
MGSTVVTRALLFNKFISGTAYSTVGENDFLANHSRTRVCSARFLLVLCRCTYHHYLCNMWRNVVDFVPHVHLPRWWKKWRLISKRPSSLLASEWCFVGHASCDLERFPCAEETAWRIPCRPAWGGEDLRPLCLVPT